MASCLSFSLLNGPKRACEMSFAADFFLFLKELCHG